MQQAAHLRRGTQARAGAGTSPSRARASRATGPAAVRDQGIELQLDHGGGHSGQACSHLPHQSRQVGGRERRGPAPQPGGEGRHRR